MLHRGDELQITIDRLAYGGRGVGRVDGLVIFVGGGVPGDRVLARVARVRRSYAEADTVAVVTASPDRVEPRCPHFGACGGCTWQHIDWTAQARAKEALVREALVHLGGFTDAGIRPLAAAPAPWFYRNKMEFSFHPSGTLGLHHRGDWNRVIPIEHCYLQSTETVALVRSVRQFVRHHGLVPYDPKTHQGFLRSLVVREGRLTGDRLIGLVTGSGPFALAQQFVDTVREVAPNITGVARGIVAGASDSAPILRVEMLHGQEYLEEILDGLRFRIGLETFFQTNTLQAARMVGHVMERTQPAAGQLIIDLYCGVGTFALALARSGAAVIGVELSSASIEAARANAELNGLDGVGFVAGDVRAVLPALVARHGPPAVVVLDPPRAGAGGKVMRKIGRSGARRVVYVSCNPTTLAPDLRELLPFGYRLVEVQPFDLFPQTYHVEAIAVLDRGPRGVS